MDKFGVPKKINRHVLKAIYTMHEDGYVHPNVDDICDAVEVTMRNNVPVRNLHSIVAQSLQNMMSCGVIEGNGSHYFVRNVDATASVSEKSSNDSQMSKPSERDMNNGSVSSGSRESQYDLSFGADYASSPRKRERLSESSLVGLSTGRMYFEVVNEQEVDNPWEIQDQAIGSNSLRNLTGIQMSSQTSAKSDSKSVNPKINVLFKSKSKETFSSPPTNLSEHGSKINVNTEETLVQNESEQGEEMTTSPSSRLLPKTEEHGK